MRRIRLWAAGLLVSAARRLAGRGFPGPAEEEEEDDLPMPAGHPVVAWSPKAREMLAEGSRPRSPPPREPERPLAGSLRDRMSRRNNP